MPLTETVIKRMANPEKETLVGDERGLYLRMYPSGRRTWLFRSRIGGAWKTRNLGEWPAISLSEARIKASALSGKNLAQSISFGDLLDEWFKVRIAPRYRTTSNIETYVANGKKWAGNDRVAQLTTARLVSMLAEYAERAPVAANRCLSNWKLALDFAVQRGYIERNPLERTTALAVGGEEKTRDRILTDDEIKSLWADDHHHAPLLRFLLLTGLRISEGQAARHEHIDGDRLLIPENKSDRPHWVYLTELAKQQVANDNVTLFNSPSPTAVQARLKRQSSGWTPHDLRRTFATRLAGLGVPPHIVEKCLNHALQGVMAVYNRHDYAEERIAAAKAWEEEIKRITAA